MAPKRIAADRDAGEVFNALVFQGGGALGSYQAGVYQALHEAGVEPSWIAGISIGAINAALIAGNLPERRLERLEQFWEMITRPSPFDSLWSGDEWRKWMGALSAFSAQTYGQPGFFQPNPVNPWFALPGMASATAFYDTTPLAATLARLVDFELINRDVIRLAVGAVEVATGNFTYFDTHASKMGPQTEIRAEHIMASGALPPGFPAVVIDGTAYWDGGLVSNTPLQHLLDNCEGRDLVVFQVDLFPAAGGLPQDMYQVLTRQKDILYSSRTRSVSDHFRRDIKMRREMRDLLDLIPKSAMSDRRRAAIMADHGLADLPRVSLIQLIYKQKSWEADHKDYEFSRATMREHWAQGYADTKATLTKTDWLLPPGNGEAIVAHDIHRTQDDPG